VANASKPVRVGVARNRVLFVLTRLLSWPALFPVFHTLQKFCLHAMNRTSAGFLPVSQTGERHVLQYVLSHVAPGRTAVVIDCGANIGVYSELVLTESRRQGVSVSLHVFEPSAHCQDQLAVRLASSPGVRIHQAAVSNQSGRAAIYYAWPGAGGTSFSSETSRIQGTSSLGQHSEDVDTVTLDEFCATAHIAAVDLVKLDIEGAELQALAGAARLIEDGRIDAIQFELGSAALSVGANLFKFWTQYSSRFEFYLVMTHGLRRIDDYSTDLECFYAASTFLLLRRR
jgi:FkbM family methyltransferase